jgi:hypothetical protein
VQYAQCGDLFSWEGHQVVTQSLGVHTASLCVYFLLFNDRLLQTIHPLDDVPVRSGQGASTAHLDQLIELCFVLGVRKLKRQLFDLQLPLEEVDWVLEVWILNSVQGHSETVHVHGRVRDLVVQLVYNRVELLLQSLNFLLVFVANLRRLRLHEGLHVLRVLEVSGHNRAVVTRVQIGVVGLL